MKIVIIGGIAAGMSAAAKAVRASKEANVVLYEKSDIISLGACGLPYYIGDFFTDSNYMIARTVEQARKSGIDVHVKHEVLSVNPDAKTLKVRNLESGETFEDCYDKLMIATGADAVIPPIKNLDLENVFTLHKMDDGLNLKAVVKEESNKNIVIIGAGYIGIEVIEAMKNIGKNVRVIQQSDSVLSGSFDTEITDIMVDEIRSHNVDLHLSENVEALEGNVKVQKIITDKGEYQADVVIVATGVRPNTNFIQDTGIKMLKNGAIIIDKHGQTSLEDIYSAGDCASVYHKVKKDNVYIPLATTANKIGRMVGENLAGATEVFEGTLGSAAIKVMDMEAGRTGLTEGEAKELGFDYDSVFITDKNQTGYYPGAHKIYVKLIYDRQSKVILGGQIIGKAGAVLRVNVLAAAIEKQMTVDELGHLDLSYSPPFSKTWDVLNVAGNVAK